MMKCELWENVGAKKIDDILFIIKVWIETPQYKAMEFIEYRTFTKQDCLNYIEWKKERLIARHGEKKVKVIVHNIFKAEIV